MTCIIDPGHKASRRVAEKCGFSFLTESEYRGSPVNVFARRRGG